MNCMVLMTLAFLATTQAIPYLGLGGLGLRARLGGLGIGGGLGMLGLPLGGGYGGARRYGHAGYLGGASGYGSRGYHGGLLHVGHNIGHQESDFSSEVHHHQSSGHDIGGIVQAGQGGHDLQGFNRYGAGNRGYGSAYGRGGYMV